MIVGDQHRINLGQIVDRKRAVRLNFFGPDEGQRRGTVSENGIGQQRLAVNLNEKGCMEKPGETMFIGLL